MKTIILSLSLVLFTITIVDAQTKKIALRSHSGANSTFTIFVPDDFGRYEPREPIERDIEVKKTVSKGKTIDSLVQCTPENNSANVKDTGYISPPLVPKQTIASKAKKKKVVRPQKHKEEKVEKIKNAKRVTKKQHQIIETTPVAPKKSSLLLLILLLTIPAILSFILYVKKR